MREFTWACPLGVMGISLLEGTSYPNLLVIGTAFLPLGTSDGDGEETWTSDGPWGVGSGSGSDHAPSISPCQHDQTCSGIK